MNPLNSFAGSYTSHFENLYKLKTSADGLIKNTKVSLSKFNELSDSIKNLEAEINVLEKDFEVLGEFLSNHKEDEINEWFHVSLPLEILNNTEALIFRSKDTVLRGLEISKSERVGIVPLSGFDRLYLGENITSKELIKKGREFLNQAAISNEEEKKEARNYAHQYLEKAAEMLIKGGQFQEAYILRKEIADNLLFSEHSLITALDNPLNNPVWGISKSNFGSGNIKRGVLTINERLYSKEEKKMQLKMHINEPSRIKLIELLNLLKTDNDVFAKVLPSSIKTQINIEIAQDGYEGVIDETQGIFDSNIQKYGLEMGEFIKINFQGVGSIKIGLSDFVSMNNRVVVEVVEKGNRILALQQMQAMLTMVGLGPVLESETLQDEERKKIALLFHTFYPKEAYEMENQQFFYEISPSQLKQEIILKCPAMSNLFDEYLTNEKLQKVQLSRECHAFAISDIADKLRQKGAVGLMAGFSGSPHSLFNILNAGLLCSQQRFETAGVANRNREGTSPQTDHYHGGAGSVFTRLINKRMIMAKLAAQYDEDSGSMIRPPACTVQRFPHSGNVQFIIDLSAMERGGYAYERDRYGSRNSEHYKNRSSFLELAGTLNHTHMGNEFMIPERISPDKILRILVENRMQKNALIEQLQKLDLTDLRDGKLYLKGLNKMPIDEFIMVGKTFTEEMWKGE